MYIKRKTVQHAISSHPKCPCNLPPLRSLTSSFSWHPPCWDVSAVESHAKPPSLSHWEEDVWHDAKQHEFGLWLLSWPWLWGATGQSKIWLWVCSPSKRYCFVKSNWTGNLSHVRQTCIQIHHKNHGVNNMTKIKTTNNHKHSPFMNDAILSISSPSKAHENQATFFCKCPTSTTSSNAFGNVFIQVLRGGCVVSTMLPVPSSLRSTSIRCSCPATSSTSRGTLMRLSPKSKTAFVFLFHFLVVLVHALWSKKIRWNLGESNKQEMILNTSILFNTIKCILSHEIQYWKCFWLHDSRMLALCWCSWTKQSTLYRENQEYAKMCGSTTFPDKWSIENHVDWIIQLHNMLVWRCWYWSSADNMRSLSGSM